MTTRFYPLSYRYRLPDIQDGLTPAYDAAWTVNPTYPRRYMQTPAPLALYPFDDTYFLAPADNPFTKEQGTNREEWRVAETSASVINILCYQFISGPLEGAQTVSGTIKGQMLTSEAQLDADARAQMMGKVVSRDGTSVTGTLFNCDTSVLSSEFTSSWQNRKFPLSAISPVTLSSVSANDGDRIVIEVGWRAHNVTATSKSAGVRLDPEDASDLPEDQTTGSGRPWFELSCDLTFEEATRNVSSALLEAVVQADTQPSVSVAMLEAAIAANPYPRVTAVHIEVLGEEYWYGWGVNLEEGD